MKWLRILCGFLAACLVCSVAMADNSQAPSEIKVGILHASSGTYASISMPVYKGFKLWAKKVNADGGVYVKPFNKKIPIKIITYDDQSSTSTATTLYSRLIEKDKVDILVADSGSVLTSVAVPIAKHHKMLLFDQTGTSRKFFSADNSYIVQLDDPVTSGWPVPLVGFLKDVAVKHGIHRVAILYSTNDFTGPQAQSLHKRLNQLDKDKLKVVYFHGVPTSTSSYTVLLHKIKAKNPDALIQLGYPDNGIAFLRDLQSSGMNFPMIFAIYPGLELDLLEKNDGKDALRNVFTFVTAIGLNYKPDVGMNMSDFIDAYHKAYGENSDAGFNSVAGYNTGLIIQKALETTKSMKQLDLRKAVFGLSGNLTTLNGHFKMNKKGAQIGELFAIGQVQSSDGGIKLVPVYPSENARGKPVWSSGK